MTKEIKILKLQNRIALLSERNKDNGRIVAKLKRQLKNLTTGTVKTEEPKQSTKQPEAKVTQTQIFNQTSCFMYL